MVAGLRERDRLRDLFGRHVGEEVVRRAVEESESFSGDEREVAIVFVDLVGSTQLATTREPHEVAAVLNDFFRIVVDEVDARRGLINKPRAMPRSRSSAHPCAQRFRRQRRWTTARGPGRRITPAPGRLRHRGVGRAGVRRQHRRGKPLRVHGCRRRRQRGGTVGRPGQGLRRTGTVLGAPLDRADAVERRCWSSARLRGATRPVATHSYLGTPCARRCPAPETGRPTAHIRPTRCSRVTYIAQRGMQMYDFAHRGVRARCPGAYPQR